MIYLENLLCKIQLVHPVDVQGSGKFLYSLDIFHQLQVLNLGNWKLQPRLFKPFTTLLYKQVQE